MANNFEKVTQRIVGQVKFKPTLSSWQDTVRVSKEFENSYEHWKIDNRQDITLYSPKEKKLLQILYNTVLYINEKEENLEELKDNVKKSFSGLSGENKEFKHLGFRNIQILGLKFEFKDLVELLYKKIYNTDILDISCDEANDVLFSIHATKDGIRNNVMLGPVTPDEAVFRFDSQFGAKDDFIQNQKFKSYLFIDVDTYCKDGEDINNIDNLIEKNYKIISDYIDYIK